MKRIVCLLLASLMIWFCIPYASGDNGFTVTYTMPDKQPDSRLKDTEIMSRLTVKRGKQIVLTMSNAGEGRTVYLEWFARPQDAALVQYDASGKTLKTTPFISPDSFSEAIPVDPACRKIVLSAKGADCTVSTLYVSEQKPAPEYGFLSVPPTVCDLLIVAPTPADVMETFGPTIAKYAIGHDMSVGIVCMTVDYRYRLQELHRALVDMGIETAPIVLDIKDNNYLEKNELHKLWQAAKPQDKLANLIRALQPKIVLTVDQKSDDLRAAETCAIVKNVVSKTSVNKFYIASGSGKTVIDCTEPIPALSGRSAHAAAKEAYRLMDSRGVFRVKLAEKPAYRLESQTVGSDRNGNDLLENIDLSALISYTVSTPAPVVTEAPSAAPTEVPTEAPEETPEPEPAVVEETTAPYIIVEEIDETPETPEQDAAPTAVPTAEPEKKGGLFSCFSGKEPEVTVEMETPAPAATEAPTAVPTEIPTEVPTEEPTPEPTEEPTPEPTEAPTPEPTEAPTPEPTEEPTPTPAAKRQYQKTNFDEHFLDEDEPEFVSFDNEKGEWIYRSDILAVEITRVETTLPEGKRRKPEVYFVAHIYEREYDSFRPGFGSWRHNGMDRCDSRDMANDAKAVLWITGDNLIQMDTDKKGILIRDGYLFQKSTRYDCLVLNPETRALEFVKKNTVKAEDLWESGVENCFSFGPILVENGKIPAEAPKVRRSTNPRTMLGMIEPGHLVAVMVVGRQAGYSEGLNGAETAQLMYDLGCVSAYNLDGGQSAAMIFMGNKLNRDSDGRFNGLSAKNRTLPDGLMWGYSPLCGTYHDLEEKNH